MGRHAVEGMKMRHCGLEVNVSLTGERKAYAGEMRAPIPVSSVAEEHSRSRISIQHHKM
jgi:hypothetical protein